MDSMTKVDYEIYDIGGEIITDTADCVVKENSQLSNLLITSTSIRAGKTTSGHSCADQDAVYYFISGTGSITLNYPKRVDFHNVKPGVVILVEKGVYNKVYNNSLTENLYFVCVLNGEKPKESNSL